MIQPAVSVPSAVHVSTRLSHADRRSLARQNDVLRWRVTRIVRTDLSTPWEWQAGSQAAPGWCAHMLEQARPVPFARRDIPPLQALSPPFPNLSLPPYAYHPIPSGSSSNGAVPAAQSHLLLRVTDH